MGPTCRTRRLPRAVARPNPSRAAPPPPFQIRSSLSRSGEIDRGKMIPEIHSTFSLLESSAKIVWKSVDSISNRIRLSPRTLDLPSPSPVAVGLHRRLLAPLKGPPVSPLPAATLAFASRRRKSSSAVCPSFAVAAAAPAVRRRRSSRRRRSGRPPSWSPSRRRPRPPLHRCCRPPEHRRRRQAEGCRRFFLDAVAVR